MPKRRSPIRSAAKPTGAAPKSTGAATPPIALSPSGDKTIMVLGALLIVAAGVLVYWNSQAVPFLYDDHEAIVENQSIRRLGNLPQVLSPPAETTVSGRPLLNASFALNYAFGGLKVRGYHATNIVIHVLAALVLFGLLRRTLSTADRLRHLHPAATYLAAATALFWVVHPLHTESVTYIVQRAESLSGLFYLLTLYCSARFFTAHRSRPWVFAAVVSCGFGIGTKEIVATAPLLVLLYDRAFFAGSVRKALQNRRYFYTALFATLLLAVPLLIRGRPGSAGFGEEAISPIQYGATQFGVVLHYLRLCLWPHPLVFDYLWPPAASAREILAPALILTLILAAAGYALWRNTATGFLAASFFLILAPTSTIIPITTELAAEHRLYLPLAAACSIVVCGGYVIAQGFSRLAQSTPPDAPNRRPLAIWATVVVLLVCAACIATILRNRDYTSAVKLWQHTVDQRPRNARAHFNLARALEDEGRVDEAIRRYQRHVVTLRPAFVQAHLNLARALTQKGRLEEALKHATQAVALRPTMPQAHNNVGHILAQLNRPTEALAHYDQAIKLSPEFSEAIYNRGNAYAALGRTQEALSTLKKSADLNPELVQARLNAGILLEQTNQPHEAAQQYRAALAVQPNYLRARQQLERLERGAGSVAPPK